MWNFIVAVAIRRVTNGRGRAPATAGTALFPTSRPPARRLRLTAGGKRVSPHRMSASKREAINR